MLMMLLKSIFFLEMCFALFHWFATTNGTVMISPSPRAAVCNVGDRLEVLCNTTESTLTWSLAVVGARNRIVRTLSTTTLIQQTLGTNSAVLTFSRLSELGRTPLTSTLVVTALSQGLNGTSISCMDVDDTGSMATTTVYIYGDMHDYSPNPPEIGLEEQFGVNTVTICLYWTQEFENSHLESFHVSIVPRNSTTLTTTNNMTVAKVTIPYNTPHNVSVIADFCGQRSATTLIELSYAKCRNPLYRPSHHKINDSKIITTYTGGPALEGSAVFFSCHPGLVLTGPNVTICMGNGEWEPDPREVMCKANCGPPSLPVNADHILPYANTLEGTRVTYICNKNQSRYKEMAICTKSGQWELNSSSICAETGDLSGRSFETASHNGMIYIAVASSVTVFVMAVPLFIVIGYLCGRKHKKMVSSETQISYYDDVVVKKHTGQKVELKQNVAYEHTGLTQYNGD